MIKVYKFSESVNQKNFGEGIVVVSMRNFDYQYIGTDMVSGNRRRIEWCDGKIEFV